MGPELIGAYAVILDLIYARGGRTTRDDRHLSGILGCSSRKARALTDQLIERGKIQFHDGFMVNSRAKSEAKSRRIISETNAKHGRMGGEKSGEVRRNKALAEANGLSEIQAESESERETEKTPSESIYVGNAIAAYNEAAKLYGWSVCQKITKPRSSRMRARLKDAGGMEGWEAALEKAAQSPFLMGQTHTPFTMGIDFLLQESSFAKLMEGRYDPRTNNSGNPSGSSGGPRQDEGSRRGGYGGAHQDMLRGFATAADRDGN